MHRKQLIKFGLWLKNLSEFAVYGCYEWIQHCSYSV